MPINDGGRVKLVKGFLSSGAGATSNGTQFYLALLTGSSLSNEPAKPLRGYSSPRQRITLRARNSNKEIENSTQVTYTALTEDWPDDIVGYAITTAPTAALDADNVVYQGTLGSVDMDLGDTLTFPNGSFRMSFE